MAFSAVVGTALLVPAIGFTSLSPGREGGRQLQVAAGGPAPATGTAEAELPSALGGSEIVEPALPAEAAAGDATPERIAPAGPPLSTTIPAEVHRRVQAIDGSSPPRTTETTRVVDDPVVRSPGTGTASGGGVGTANSASSGGAAAAPSGPTQSDPALAACPAADVRVTVSTDKATYAPGDTVRFSSTLENRSATTCLVSGRAFFSIENAAGKTVSSFAYTADYMLPVKATPGQTFTNTGTWNQQDCTGPACLQAPAGTYVVVAGWTEGGPYTGRGSFQIGA